MQSSVLCVVRVNMMERRPLVAIGRKATDQIHDSFCVCKLMYFVLCVTKCAAYLGQDPLVNEILNLQSF